MKKRYLALALAFLILAGLLGGCKKAEEKPAAQSVTLTVIGGWEDCKAIESVGREFTAKYPECTIVYEYLQDFYAAAQKRMAGENAADLFFSVNLQEGSELLPSALELRSRADLDLSNTFGGLIDNFAYLENGARSDKLYALPLGAELRGLYVNKTLLKSLGLEVPTDQASLLAACAVLKENGYIAFHGNPGDFAQMLLYPWICNLIANADDPQAAYDRVNARESGVSEMFREPFEFLYTLVENDYYDYKRAQTDLGLYLETTDLAYARDFLNIRPSGDNWEKADDLGQVAFMPSTMSFERVVSKVKDDYHSGIDYEFVLAPVSPEGGCAYMSPAHGIAVNKNGQNLDWSVKFIDFLFQPENNKRFAEEFNIIPNTKEAFDYIATLYDIPGDRISQLGQVTFDFDFYNAITPSLVETSKANNPKYMLTNDDGTQSLYPLDDYLNHLEESIKGNE